MATPLFNLNLTIISDCDATTGWDDGATEPDIKKQGTNSLVTAIRSSGTVTYTGGPFDMSAVDTHIRLWFFHTFAGFLDLKANGGIQLFVTDGNGNRNSYYVGGSDTHEGSWELFSANLAIPDVGGGANLANITSAGFELVHATNARNIDNTYWDYFTFGTGYEVYGGTTGDRVTWDTISIEDDANGYGVLLRQNGVYFINGRIILGDTVGTNDFYFDGSSGLSVFYDRDESTSLYNLTGTGNATGTTDILIDNAVLKSASTRFEFFGNNTNLDALSTSGTQFNNAGSIEFKLGQIVDGCTFIDCGQINPLASTFTGNSISGYIGTSGGALRITDTVNMSGLSFTSSGTGHAIYIDTVGTYDFTEFSYSGYGATGTTDAVVYNNSGGAVTINVVGGTTPTYLNGVGATTTVNNNVSITLTGMKDNTEVRVYEAGTTTEITGIEDATAGTIDDRSFTFSIAAGLNIDIRIFNIDWISTNILNYTTPSSNATIPVTQVTDRVYSNP